MNNQLEALYKALVDKAHSFIVNGLEVKWYYPPSPQKNPLQATIGPDWIQVDPRKPCQILKDKENWFYADVVFPKSYCNFKLDAGQAYITIRGWSPFKLWVDGHQAYEEKHNWAATGPIADPFVTSIQPGKTYRLIYCILPTTAGAYGGGGIMICPYVCLDYAATLLAFCTEIKLAATLARTKAEKQTVEDICRDFDYSLIRRNQWKQMISYIAASERKLQCMSARAKALTVHLIAHNHIDMDWQWTWKDTVYCFRRDAKSALDFMADRPDLTMSMSQIPFYQVIEQQDPDLFNRIKEHIHSGRWINTAGTWVEGDLNMADGEAIARNMQYATDWCKQHLGRKADVLWEPDTFGHPGNMPQLARLGEYDTYFHWRCNPGGDANWPVRMWEGVDGTSVFTLSSTYGGTLLPSSEMFSTFHNLHHSIAIGLKNSHHIWGCGDHGGGLPRYQMELLEKNLDRPLLPSIRFSTFEAYRNAVCAEAVELKHNRGVTHHLFEGCYTTHARCKHSNRKAEAALLNAESIAAMAGVNQNNALQAAWIPVLFNQFHDIFCGAAVPEAYRDADARYAAALRSCRRLTDKALARRFQMNRQGRTVTVVNPTGFARSGVMATASIKGISHLEDEAGRKIPVQTFRGKGYFHAEQVAALAARHYAIATTREAESSRLDLSEDDLHYCIDTPLYTCRISKQSGAIVSYWHKQLQRDLINFGTPKVLSHTNVTRKDLAMNVFQVIDEAPNEMSAWQINDILKMENLLRNAQVKLMANGPVFACFEVQHKFRSSRIKEHLYLYRHSDHIDFEVEVDWREGGSHAVGVPQLKLSFNTAMSQAQAHFDGPFSVAEYPADGQEQVTQKFVDVTGKEFGFTLVNDSTYGCDVLGGRARVTLLRNSYSPDSNSDNGRHHFRFAFLPHQAQFRAAECIRSGIAFNRPMECFRSDEEAAMEAAGLEMDGPDQVVCTAHRLAEHSERILLRFFECSCQPCEIRVACTPAIRDAVEVNFQETEITGRQIPARGRLTLKFRAYEVKTILVANPKKRNAR